MLLIQSPRPAVNPRRKSARGRNTSGQNRVVHDVTARRILLWLAFSAAGVVIGFGLAFVAASAVSLVLPHCGLECDDTLPEFVAAAAAYGTWALSAVTTSVLAWREISDR